MDQSQSQPSQNQDLNDISQNFYSGGSPESVPEAEGEAQSETVVVVTEDQDDEGAVFGRIADHADCVQDSSQEYLSSNSESSHYSYIAHNSDKVGRDQLILDDIKNKIIKNPRKVRQNLR